MSLPCNPDPKWLEMVADADVDAMWDEWRTRLDRLVDHTPANELPPAGCVSPSPSAAGLLLLPSAGSPHPSSKEMS